MKKESSGTNNKTLPSAQLEILWALRRISQILDIQSRRLAMEHHITLPQFLCLISIVSQEGQTARQISSRVHLSASTLVGILDRLEGKGLIHRQRDTVDRRMIFIVPTERGRQLVSRLPFPLGDTFQMAFARLPDRTQKALASSIQQLVELLDAAACSKNVSDQAGI